MVAWRSHAANPEAASGAREAGAASAEGAGLVIFKTSPEQLEQIPAFHWENDSKIISFDATSCRLKRLKNLRRAVFHAGELQKFQKSGFRQETPWFVTLTYAEANAWQPDHIAVAIDAYRHWCGRRGVVCKYVWVGELTKTGRVHYHLICWLPHGVRMTFWDRPRRVKGKKTQAFWIHGMSNTQPSKKGVAYLMKYLSKMGELHVFPKGMRLHGVGGLTPEARAIKAWSNLPLWVRADHGVGDIKRLGCGYLDTTSGEILEPMYRREFIPGGVVIHRLRDFPDKVFDHGAFSTFPRCQ